jgi:peptidoglycan/xylan/chitin deacetylase (PgdA/CDA1 family)
VPHLHWLAGTAVVLSVVVGLTGSPVRIGSGDRPRAAHAVDPARPAAAARERGEARGGPVAPPGAASGTLAPATAAARQARANELGEVPVLMYHRIEPKAQTSLDRTPQELVAELEHLARSGYVPVTAAEFVSGRIDIPAGRHPVVLTFDDGDPSHFALDAQGNPRPDTAVGILMDFARGHPGFRPVATFYVNQEPFQLHEAAGAGLRWLVGHGFDVANHTMTHPDLTRMSKEVVQQEISRDERQIRLLTGAHATTLAFPFGGVPERRDWALWMKGEYDFQGAFLTGWKPSASPFAADFDPYAIPRIRSEEKIDEDDCRRYCSVAWLEWLDGNPGRRYTSDGDRRVISFPRAESARLDKRFTGLGRFY